MSDDMIIGPDGLPDGYVDNDVLTARALRIAGLLAITSPVESDVEAILRIEVLENELPPMLKFALAALVVQEMTIKLFAPLLTVLQVEHLDTDFIAQLRTRSGLNHGAPNTPNDGDTSPGNEA